MKLKYQLPIPRSASFLLISSVILVPFLLTAKSVAQSPNSPTNKETGFIFESIPEPNKAKLTTMHYLGECVGTTFPVVKAWFTSATTPPDKKRKVTIRTVTPGVDPDKQPYVTLQYKEGTVSWPTTIEFGTAHYEYDYKHDSIGSEYLRRLRVRPGENQFQYEIKRKKEVLESGSFKSVIENEEKTEMANSTFETGEECANSSVSNSVCADMRTVKKRVCPGGRILSRDLDPQGLVRTLISNQTFSPIVYQLDGRIYRLEPGQDQTLTGDRLGSLKLPDPNSPNPNSNFNIGKYLTPGTRYQFIINSYSKQPELQEWYKR